LKLFNGIGIIYEYLKILALAAFKEAIIGIK